MWHQVGPNSCLNRCHLCVPNSLLSSIDFLGISGTKLYFSRTGQPCWLFAPLIPHKFPSTQRTHFFSVWTVSWAVDNIQWPTLFRYILLELWDREKTHLNFWRKLTMDTIWAFGEDLRRFQFWRKQTIDTLNLNWPAGGGSPWKEPIVGGIAVRFQYSTWGWCRMCCLHVPFVLYQNTIVQ